MQETTYDPHSPPARASSPELKPGAEAPDVGGALQFTDADRADYDALITRWGVLRRENWYQATRSLDVIKARHLYRIDYPDFEAFCQHKLKMTQMNADRLLRSSEVVLQMGTDDPKPATEAHIRPLLRLDNGEDQIRAFRNAVSRAEADGKPLTGLRVRRQVDAILGGADVAPPVEPGDTEPLGELIPARPLHRLAGGEIVQLPVGILTAYDLKVGLGRLKFAASVPRGKMRVPYLARLQRAFLKVVEAVFTLDDAETAISDVLRHVGDLISSPPSSRLELSNSN